MSDISLSHTPTSRTYFKACIALIYTIWVSSGIIIHTWFSLQWLKPNNSKGINPSKSVSSPLIPTSQGGKKHGGHGKCLWMALSSKKAWHESKQAHEVKLLYIRLLLFERCLWCECYIFLAWVKSVKPHLFCDKLTVPSNVMICDLLSKASPGAGSVAVGRQRARLLSGSHSGVHQCAALEASRLPRVHGCTRWVLPKTLQRR